MKASSLSHVFFSGLLWTSVYGNLLGRKEDDTKYAYACLTEGVVEVKCPKNEKINISQVLYGGEPDGCGAVFSKKNDCQQYSTSRTAAAHADCDGRQSCQVAIEPLNSDVLDQEGILPVRNGCPVDGQYHQQVYVNYMVVKYKCQAFLFCTDIEETQMRNLIVETKGFPLTVTTNPTCECTFGSGGESRYISIMVRCNGTALLSVVETIESSEDDSKLVTHKNEYFCDNAMPPKSLRIGNGRSRALTVSVVAANSSERTAFSFTPIITRMAFSGGTLRRKMDLEAKVVLSCKEGSLWLPYTVTLILQIGVPIMAVLIIALIVIYCCVKKRRKKAKEWRRKHVSLRSKATNNGSYHGSSIARQTPASPLGSYSSSTPSSTRRKPDGKLDSGSEEDLAQTAARLHRQNTQRRAEEIKKRDEYYGNGGSGIAYGPPSRPPQTYAQQYYEAAMQREQVPEHTAYTDGGRRCMSIGNLPRCAAADARDNPSSTPLLPRARSASQSRPSRRTNSRSTLPVPPYRTHANSSTSINHDHDDPDLTFDDPRQGDRSRDATPVRDMIGRSPLYGERISHSVSNLRHSNSTRGQPLQGTKSASQSRTSLRSMKRRAPQPPTHLPVTNSARSGPRAPVRNRANTPSSSVNFSKNHNKSHPKKYFNPYAVRLPQSKSNSKTQGASLGENEASSSGVVMSHDLPKCEHRRYSDSGSMDESDHGGADMDQVGMMGDFDGDLMDEDQW